MSAPQSAAPRAQALLALEQEKAPQKRAEAAEQLAELGEVSDVPRLLADAQLEVRRAGLALAGVRLPPGEAKDLLVRFLSDAAFELRLEATGRLADLELPEARAALTGGLQAPEFALRFEAARGIAALKHPAGIEVLVEALDERDFRFRAAAALAWLGDAAAIAPLLRVLQGWFVPAFDRTQVAGALAVLGAPEGEAHLFKRIGKPLALDRPMAVEFLGELRSAAARAKLLEILDAPADFARGTAARALGFHGGDDVTARLRTLLGSDAVSDDFKLDVAEGLLRLGERNAVEALQLEDPRARQELATLLEDYATP